MTRQQAKDIAQSPVTQWIAIALTAAGLLVAVGVSHGSLSTRVATAEADIDRLKTSQELLIRIDERVVQLIKEVRQLKGQDQNEHR